MSRYVATRSVPNYPELMKDSRMVPDDQEDNFKQFKTAGLLSWIMTDHPVPSRTVSEKTGRTQRESNTDLTLNRPNFSQGRTGTGTYAKILLHVI